MLSRGSIGAFGMAAGTGLLISGMKDRSNEKTAAGIGSLAAGLAIGVPGLAKTAVMGSAKLGLSSVIPAAKTAAKVGWTSTKVSAKTGMAAYKYGLSPAVKVTTGSSIPALAGTAAVLGGATYGALSLFTNNPGERMLSGAQLARDVFTEAARPQPRKTYTHSVLNQSVQGLTFGLHSRR